jgi:hypothetical protein
MTITNSRPSSPRTNSSLTRNAARPTSELGSAGAAAVDPGQEEGTEEEEDLHHRGPSRPPNTTSDEDAR